MLLSSEIHHAHFSAIVLFASTPPPGKHIYSCTALVSLIMKLHLSRSSWAAETAFSNICNLMSFHLHY